MDEAPHRIADTIHLQNGLEAEGAPTMSTKAEQIIDHFTDDADLKAKILEQIRRAKEEGATLDDIVAEFTGHPGIQAKIKEIAGKMRKGHSVHHITGYHHSDPAKAQRAAEKILKHTGVVEHIMKQ